jgi:hypothetical protein
VAKLQSLAPPFMGINISDLKKTFYDPKIVDEQEKEIETKIFKFF